MKLATLLSHIAQGFAITYEESSFLWELSQDHCLDDLNHVLQKRYLSPWTLEICYETDNPWPEYQLQECGDGEFRNQEWLTCNDWVDTQDSGWNPRLDCTRWNGSWYTDEYLDEETFVCERCDERYWISDHEEDGVCRHCYSDYSDDDDCDYGGIVKSYSANVITFGNANERFFANGRWSSSPDENLVFGVELELDPRFSRRELAENLHGIPRSIIKSDGSIQGVEFVTKPFDLAGHKNRMQWTRVMEAANEFGEATRQCGMHIHINRAALSELTQAKLLLFVNHVDHKEFMTDIAGRDFHDHGYCQAKGSHEASPAKQLKLNKREGRYSAVNMSNERTIELRIFASTTSYERLMANIEFADAIVNFCNTNSLLDINPDKFGAWVRKNHFTYKNLTDLLSQKGHITAVPVKLKKKAA